MTTEKAEILIVEDDQSQLELLAYRIESAGHRVLKASTGIEALEILEENEPDLVLLDWMLPGVSGIDICKRIRADERLSAMPMVIVSARAEEFDRVRGLEVGADDYVVKPYSMSELLARLKAHLRRFKPATVGEILRFDDIELNAEQHRVFRSGKPVKLGPTEFRLLSTFLERPGRVWSREQLLDRVWGKNIYVENRTVDVHIGRLRKALCRYGGDDPLRTVRGAGYSLG